MSMWRRRNQNAAEMSQMWKMIHLWKLIHPLGNQRGQGGPFGVAKNLHG
jgi:hypothetical protein